MNPFITTWFWLLIISIIGIVISVILFETRNLIDIAAWIWVLFILSIIFFIIAFALYCIDLYAYHQYIKSLCTQSCIQYPSKIYYLNTQNCSSDDDD